MHLNHYTCGEGFPLVILHGLFGSSDNWLTLSRKFQTHYRVFALDLRNHGKSPHDAEVTYPAMASDIAEFLDAHQLSDVMLLGHSMGGKVAMQFANDFPQRVRRLGVADIAPRTYPRQHDKLFAAILGLDLALYRSRGEVDRALAPQIPNIALRQFLLKNLANTETGGLRWRNNLRALHDGYDTLRAAPPLTQPFAGPTLFVRGEKSDYIREQDEPVIRQWFPRADLVTLPGAGHWLHAEKPVEFFQIVEQFLSSQS